MRKKIVAIVFAIMLLATLALPATALAHGGEPGCHFGPLNEITPPFDGRDWGERNSTNAKSVPGARADFVNKREVCRS